MIEFTSKNLQFVGGQFIMTERSPSDYIKPLSSEALPFCVIETVQHGARFGRSTDLVVDNAAMTRLHLFGPGGDFMLRRDANLFYWRYVGCVPTSFPEPGRDFWKAHPEIATLCLEDCAPMFSMLWGKHSHGGEWYADRVGHANLLYPIEGQPERVLLCSYRLETVEGHPTPQVAAYWSTAIGSVDEKTGVPPCPTS